MLPASSWARYGLKTPTLPAHLIERAADCGGFVAARCWGSYRYSPADYVAWLETFQPQWAACMDLCCEDEMTGGRPGVVRERQQWTTEMAWHFWQTYRDVPWVWVPTIQGWSIDEYVWHALELRPLLREMQQHYGLDSAWRVGIGTLCRRASAAMIQRIVAALCTVAPGYSFHLWGVKLAVLQAPEPLPLAVVSTDSAAWNGLYGRGIEEWRQAEGKPRQREYTYGVRLPRYVRKVSAAVRAPKQLSLFDSVA